MPSLVLLAFALLLAGLVTLGLANRRRTATGLPGGEVIYSDTQRWGPVEKPLYDDYLELTGRPDYLIRQGTEIIPVEVKSTRVGEAPYDSHIFQLAAYCYLVNKTYGIRPSHGVLHYPNRTYRIPYTERLEKELLALIRDMRAKGHRRKINRSHQSPARCRRCGYRHICDQRL